MIARYPGANPKASFSNAVAVALEGGRLVYVSGQLGRDASGKIPEAFEDEVWQCFENVRKALAQAGAMMSDVVRMTTYLSDLTPYPAFDRARARAFGSDLPASATVQVAGLLGNARIEIDAIAFMPATAEKSVRRARPRVATAKRRPRKG